MHQPAVEMLLNPGVYPVCVINIEFHGKMDYDYQLVA